MLNDEKIPNMVLEFRITFDPFFASSKTVKIVIFLNFDAFLGWGMGSNVTRFKSWKQIWNPLII